jgi:hypothetical protein
LVLDFKENITAQETQTMMLLPLEDCLGAGQGGQERRMGIWGRDDLSILYMQAQK